MGLESDKDYAATHGWGFCAHLGVCSLEDAATLIAGQYANCATAADMGKK